MSLDDNGRYECPVCGEHPTAPVYSICYHMFCQTCIIKALNPMRDEDGILITSGGTCPICRTQLLCSTCGRKKLRVIAAAEVDTSEKYCECVQTRNRTHIARQRPNIQQQQPPPPPVPPVPSPPVPVPPPHNTPQQSQSRLGLRLAAALICVPVMFGVAGAIAGGGFGVVTGSVLFKSQIGTCIGAGIGLIGGMMAAYGDLAGEGFLV